MASSVVIEEQVGLEITFRWLSPAELVEHLEISIGKYTDKSRLVVTRLLREKKNKNNVESHGSPEESVEFLSGLDNEPFAAGKHVIG